jgi:hypothetical protein
MSRMPRRAESSIAVSSKPMPPISGWTLMEAAVVLCPNEAKLWKEGAELLQDAISNEPHRMNTRAIRSPWLRSDAWLTVQLLKALSTRPDLQVSGRPANSAIAARTSLAPDIIRDALESDRGIDTIRRWMHLFFKYDRIDTGHDVPADHGFLLTESLFDIRIEAVSSQLGQAGGKRAAAKKKQGEAVDIWGAWYAHRRAAWPKDLLPPTFREDLAAGIKHIGYSVPREHLRAIRDQHWGEIPMKSGPRRRSK